MKQQIKLAYNFNDLEPVIDTLTMETHYSKHHKTYTDNLNTAINNNPELQGKCVKCLLKDINNLPQHLQATIRNNGGGFLNHNLYFDIISPNPQALSGTLKTAIENTFMSLENLKAQLVDIALAQFGSGWAWLAVNEQDKSLAVLATANQDSPFMSGYYPILGIDVWEHAYYLKYKNLRKAYVEALLEIIDWDKVATHYEKALAYGNKCQE